MGQWLRLCTSNAEGIGSISGWETKIPHDTQCSKKKAKLKMRTKQAKQKICKTNQKPYLLGFKFADRLFFFKLTFSPLSLVSLL